MSLAVVTLKKGEGRLLKSGGMWIFETAALRLAFQLNIGG